MHRMRRPTDSADPPAEPSRLIPIRRRRIQKTALKTIDRVVILGVNRHRDRMASRGLSIVRADHFTDFSAFERR